MVLISANVDTSREFGISIIKVENTEQLQSALQTEFPKCDVLIMAAAVSDARPIPATGKVKKQSYNKLDLVPTPDLLADIAKQKNSQILVGFAAEESANLLQEGKRKLASKGLDFIYANDIANGTIFGADTTSGLLISAREEEIEEIHEISKDSLATRLLNKVSERLNSPNV